MSVAEEVVSELQSRVLKTVTTAAVLGNTVECLVCASTLLSPLTTCCNMLGHGSYCVTLLVAAIPLKVCPKYVSVKIQESRCLWQKVILRMLPRLALI